MFAVEIELQFNPNVTGSLVQAMGSGGFVQFPESDLKYSIETIDSIDVVADVVMQTLRKIGLDNARVQVIKA